VQFPPFSTIIELGGTDLPFRQVTIGTLPDNALLEIFSFYVEEAYQDSEDPEWPDIKQVETWNTLVHVCRRWRYVVFASPCRLNLRVVCTSRRPVSEMLDIWPTLPIIMDDYWELGLYGHQRPHIVENILATLGHRDRICRIRLGNLPLPLLDRFTALMNESFPALTHLRLYPDFELAPDLPDSFLNGSAPHLRSFILEYIPFPALPKLLLSTSSLVELFLTRIPHSGYIPPESMATCLSSLTRLETFSLGFDSPRSRPDQSGQDPSSFTRVDLPVLIKLSFWGVSEYIEDLAARINAPLLLDVWVGLYNRLLFDISQIRQFIDRINIFEVLHQAQVRFTGTCAILKLYQLESTIHDTSLVFQISSKQSEWQLSSLAKVCASLTSPIPLFCLERLILSTSTSPGHWYNDMDSIQWLELFRPFAAVKDLYIDKELAPRVVQGFQELVGERATEVLPAIQCFFVEGHQQFGAIQGAIGPFIATRQLLGHPVAIHLWERHR
jgi:hypothetical protein